MSETPEQDSEIIAAVREKETSTWAMVLHLSILAGMLIPVAGLVVPILIYTLKKDDLPGLKPHADVVFNWLISALIYGAISVVLMILLIGAFLLWLLGLACLIFSIIGAIKASEGEVWPYPLTIVRVFS